MGTSAATHDDHHHEMSFLSKYIFSTDHKVICMQYLFTGMIMAMIGGYFAYVFRMQLGFPGEVVPGYGLVNPGEYNSLVTNHGTHNDFLGSDAGFDRCLRQLPHPFDDRC